MTEFGEGMMWLAVGLGQVAFWFAVSPIIRAWSDRIRAKGRPEIPGGEARIAELEARLERLEGHAPITGEVEAQYQRVAELEERIDFAERLLTRADAGSQHLPQPRGGPLDS
jgi:hypothetical protein